jgi:uncharacterized protein (TIGR02453 family)
MNGFMGIPNDAFDFFVELEANNTKAFWLANKHRYDAIRHSMLELGEAVDPRYRPLRVYRPNRDVRFSKDKSPYKTNIGALGETQGGSMLYVHLDADGMFAASGQYMMSKDQLDRFRRGLDADRTGKQLQQLIDKLVVAGFAVSHGGEAPLKSAPRGFPADHVRVHLLRWKGIIATRTFGAPDWLHSARLATEVSAAWAEASPLCDWLERHVGPSEETR